MRDENFEGQPYSDQPNIPLAENIARLQSKLTASQARVGALEAMLELPDDLCIACGGTGGHFEGCTGTTGLIAMQARVKELEQNEVRPRVHGNGFIQLDLSKSKRLHIFGDPMIPKQVIETPIHDHTFGFSSEILSGELTNVWLDLVDDPNGTHNVFQARVRYQEDTVLENMGRRVRLVERKRVTFRAGDSYSMLPGEFHESLATGRTVTIITKDGPSLSQGGSSPRVLVAVGSQPDNDFNRYAESPETLWRIITGGERIATLEQALREAGTWARAEQAVIDCPEYSKQAQDDLRSKLKVPARFRTLGDYLDELRQKALATISTALNEKEGK